MSYISDAAVTEIAGSVVKAMIDLMATGFVLPVIDHFKEQAERLDQALLRDFLMGVMDLAKPPYSRVFRDRFVALLEEPKAHRAGINGGLEFDYRKKRFLAGAVQ